MQPSLCVVFFFVLNYFKMHVRFISISGANVPDQCFFVFVVLAARTLHRAVGVSYNISIVINILF